MSYKPCFTFSFPFPEEMDGLIDFLFVRGLFLGNQPSKNIKKSDYNFSLHFH